ncbi:hypothetical protein EZS27_009899 [termite gut metagenome]|uniref:DUF4276 family protein n=1 Tax=termite gut metagenome TaxID=433724 RepID=A0A5J4SAL5_9ZZZZ
MRKIAFFVEGQTEASFIQKLLEEIVNEKYISIIITTYSRGGRSGTPRSGVIESEKIVSDEKYIANICISGTDNRVNSDISDNLQTLKDSGFELIVGLRDLRGDLHGHPATLADLPKMENANKQIFKGKLPNVHIVIAVMEIETWFIGETNHYLNIDPRLTPDLITGSVACIGINPYIDDLTLIMKPAETLHNIYSLVNKNYSKKIRERTINALDFANVYLGLPSKIGKIKELIDILDAFLI